jgi:hypothetical protein
MWADLIKQLSGRGDDMARKRISSSNLIWMFHERLKEYEDHPFNGISLAIVPGINGEWTVVTQARVPKREPDLVSRIRKIEKKLRQEYMLAAE